MREKDHLDHIEWMNQEIYAKEKQAAEELSLLKEEINKLKASVAETVAAEKQKLIDENIKMISERLESDMSYKQKYEEEIERHKNQLKELNEDYTSQLKLKDKKRHQGYQAYEEQISQLKEEMQKKAEQALDEQRKQEQRHKEEIQKLKDEFEIKELVYRNQNQSTKEDHLEEYAKLKQENQTNIQAVNAQLAEERQKYLVSLKDALEKQAEVERKKNDEINQINADHQKVVDALRDEMEDMRRGKDAVITKMIESVETQRKKFEAEIDELKNEAGQGKQ